MKTRALRRTTRGPRRSGRLAHGAFSINIAGGCDGFFALGHCNGATSSAPDSGNPRAVPPSSPRAVWSTSFAVDDPWAGVRTSPAVR
jgi:hypothetical protein